MSNDFTPEEVEALRKIASSASVTADGELLLPCVAGGLLSLTTNVLARQFGITNWTVSGPGDFEFDFIDPNWSNLDLVFLCSANVSPAAGYRIHDV